MYHVILYSRELNKDGNEIDDDGEAPVKIGKVNKSIPPVIKRAQGNNGIVFNVR